MVPQPLLDALSKLDTDQQATTLVASTVQADVSLVSQAQSKLSSDQTQLSSLQQTQATDLKAAQDLLNQFYGGPSPTPTPSEQMTSARGNLRGVSGASDSPTLRLATLDVKARAMGISLAQLLALLEQLLPLIGPIFNPAPAGK